MTSPCFNLHPLWLFRINLKKLLSYVTSNSSVILRYHKSNMNLYVDSEVAYLVASKARSRIAGFYYFKYDQNNNIITPSNHLILMEYRCLKHVVLSADEAETAGIFANTKLCILIWQIRSSSTINTHQK